MAGPRLRGPAPAVTVLYLAGRLILDRGGQRDLPVLVAAVPEPPPRRRARPGAAGDPGGCVRDPHLPGDVPGPRRGGGDAAGHAVGPAGGRRARPLAGPQPARTGAAGRAGPHPRGDPHPRLDDSAATLRRIERDLHDGTQAQLATLAMHLGQAKEKLQHDADVPFDPAGAFELVDVADTPRPRRRWPSCATSLGASTRRRSTVGLDTALATLVARSAVPSELAIDVCPSRPSPAIESIAYFSAAELLANVARHSGAAPGDGRRRRPGRLVGLTVRDDGSGGRPCSGPPVRRRGGPGAGTGLPGLADRVHAVDGRLERRQPERRPHGRDRRAAAAGVTVDVTVDRA